MNQQEKRSGQRKRWTVAALFLGLLFSILGLGQTVKADEAGWTGRVEVMPASGLIGEWTVRGRVFVTSNSTEFRQDKGALAVNACVEVEYTGQSAPFQATKMATKHRDDCANSATPTAPGTPSATPDASATPSQTPVAGSEQEAYGRINRMPLGLVGEWLIGNGAYRSTISTEFKREAGPFTVGACVKVHYIVGNTPLLIREIETTEGADCSGVRPTGTATVPGIPDSKAKATALIDSKPITGLLGIWVLGGIEYQVAPGARLRQANGPFVVGACVEVEYLQETTPRKVLKLETKEDDCTESDGPTATPTLVPTAPPVGAPGQEFEVYGRVSSLPATLIGEWVVDGVTYTADEHTEFKEEHGIFTVGRCVKLHALSTTSPATITEIENERGFYCAPGQDGEHQGEGELFGELQDFPDGLIGEWNIGGMTFVAMTTTEFKQRNGAFTIGATVKVHFVVDANGVNVATEIETKFAHEEHGHDHDGDGVFDGGEGHAFGTIESKPTTGLIGDWAIGGITYTVVAETRILEEPSNFVVGAKVRVKYYTNANDQRIVRILKTTSEESGADDPSHFTLFGYVDQMPPSGFAGEWVLDHIAFVATGQTQFTEDHGVLALGAYVKVEYFIRNGRNVIHELETQVPPGAGDDLNIGEIASTGDNIAAAGVSGTVWVIGGKSYTVTPATDINDLQSDLAVGSTALVNSYTAADGSQVATQILGVTLANNLYLPLAQR